ncbi:hypothetical protein C0995_007020 [Termitomyces sp. Mi166|nr:hypothetical protein C0995_007020 [Termitomyces sp. Mi166\
MQSDDFIPPRALSARTLRPVPLPPTVSASVSDAEILILGCNCSCASAVREFWGSSLALLSPPIPSPRGHGTDHEVLDEEEGDPINPSFHSPSRRTSLINSLPATDPLAPEPVVVPEEDEQAARRRTIAERMAELCGIKFSAAPPLPHVARSLPPVPKEEEAEHEDASEQLSGAS